MTYKEFEYKDDILIIKEYFSKYKQGYFKMSFTKQEVSKLVDYLIEMIE